MIIRNHPPDRRLVRVPISFDLLIEMVTQGSLHMGRNRLGLAPTCVKGLPSDASFIGSYTDNARARGYLIFYHSSFDQVPESEELPEFVPEFRSDNYITPFDGMRIEFVSAGHVIVHRRPDIVQAQYVQTTPAETFHTDEGGSFMALTGPTEDQITFTSEDVSLQDRVRYVRDVNRVPRELQSITFPGSSGKTPQT